MSPSLTHSAQEKELLRFDMNADYGPCIGISRRDRWQRAKKHGLNPPLHIKDYLDMGHCNENAAWDNLLNKDVRPDTKLK
eukprot:561155-Amorphochlora_amoeboformis.AAC.1